MKFSRFRPNPSVYRTRTHFKIIVNSCSFPQKNYIILSKCAYFSKIAWKNNGFSPFSVVNFFEKKRILNKRILFTIFQKNYISKNLPTHFIYMWKKKASEKHNTTKFKSYTSTVYSIQSIYTRNLPLGYSNEWNDNKYYVQYVYMLGIVRMVTLLQFMLSSDHSAAITMADVAVGDKWPNLKKTSQDALRSSEIPRQHQNQLFTYHRG